MTKLEAAVTHAAKQLRKPSRRRLASELSEEIDPPMSKEWINEIQRRVADLESGKVESIPGPRVFKRVRASRHARQVRRAKGPSR